jgi:hypothetical protein
MLGRRQRLVASGGGTDHGTPPRDGAHSKSALGSQLRIAGGNSAARSSRLGDFYAGALHPLTDLQDGLLWTALGLLAGSLGAIHARHRADIHLSQTGRSARTHVAGYRAPCLWQLARRDWADDGWVRARVVTQSHAHAHPDPRPREMGEGQTRYKALAKRAGETERGMRPTRPPRQQQRRTCCKCLTRSRQCDRAC